MSVGDQDCRSVNGASSWRTIERDWHVTELAVLSLLNEVSWVARLHCC
jgi:hypothetical protein